MKDKILITGSTGFVGQNLLQYLGPSKSINSPSRSQLSNLKRSELTDVEAVIHLAGKAHDLRNAADPKEYYEVNFELTKMLYDEFLHSNAKKFIYVSSVKAVRDSVKESLSENDDPNPLTDYGKSKLMAEQYIISQVLPQGKSYFILRPCMIHGPANKGNLNQLFNLVVSGIPYPFAAFSNQRSFLTIENLCFVFEQLLDRFDIPSGVYNVADETPLSSNEVVNVFAKELNKKSRMWRLSPKFINIIARFGDLSKLPFNSHKLNKLTENYIVDTAKLKSVLGRSLPVSSRDGMIITAQSFYRNLKSK